MVIVTQAQKATLDANVEKEGTQAIQSFLETVWSWLADSPFYVESWEWEARRDTMPPEYAYLDVTLALDHDKAIDATQVGIR